MHSMALFSLCIHTTMCNIFLPGRHLWIFKWNTSTKSYYKKNRRLSTIDAALQVQAKTSDGPSRAGDITEPWKSYSILTFLHYVLHSLAWLEKLTIFIDAKRKVVRRIKKIIQIIQSSLQYLVIALLTKYRWYSTTSYRFWIVRKSFLPSAKRSSKFKDTVT